MSELLRRQSEASRYRAALAKEREERYAGPGKRWSEMAAVEMLLVIQAMKYEYHPAPLLVVRHFCDITGLNFEELEVVARMMVSDDPNKPQP